MSNESVIPETDIEETTTETVQASEQPRKSPINTIIALVVIVAIVGATWFLGERNGWTDIGTGGSNARLIPHPGDEAPEFFTLREDLEPMALSQYRGQPVWLNFWGSWCAPCRDEMPEFISAYDTLTSEGIVVLPVSVGESPDKSMRYRDIVGGNFPVYIDPSYISYFVNADENPEQASRFESMRQDWQIYNYPTHVFIDADGIVRNVILAQMSEEEMLETARALKEPAPTQPAAAAIFTRFD